MNLSLHAHKLIIYCFGTYFMIICLKQFRRLFLNILPQIQARLTCKYVLCYDQYIQSSRIIKTKKICVTIEHHSFRICMFERSKMTKKYVFLYILSNKSRTKIGKFLVSFRHLDHICPLHTDWKAIKKVSTLTGISSQVYNSRISTYCTWNVLHSAGNCGRNV